MMVCTECGGLLNIVPLYNNNDENFPPYMPFCPNEECSRHGLLTTTFKTKDEEEDKKDSDKKSK